MAISWLPLLLLLVQSLSKSRPIPNSGVNIKSWLFILCSQHLPQICLIYGKITLIMRIINLFLWLYIFFCYPGQTASY